VLLLAPLALPAPAATKAAATPADGERASRALPASLRGTEVDGGLEESAGRFVPTLEARRFFDYWLSATGEVPPDQIRARAVSQITTRLSAGAASEAVATLDRYLAYLERTRTLSCKKAEPGDLVAAFDQVHDLRRDVLGDELAGVFFGAEEAQDRLALVSIEAARRNGKDQPELRAELEAALPDEARIAAAEATIPLRLLAEEASLKAQGDLTALRQLREESVGREAADRLEALDRELADWGRRMADYRAERAELEAQGLSDAGLAAAVERLRAERFSAAERVRVEALDRIERQLDRTEP
jgi:lipase chaperone LimK